MTLPPSTPAVLRDRTRWHLGANAPVVAWLAALLVITLTRSQVAESPWLMVHLLLLGAVTNAIFVWSSHFAGALDPSKPWHGRLMAAHIMTNLLGWVGLTVMGTLVTLWPTMLRTRIAENAERVARQALPVLAGSVIVAVSGALFGLRAVAAIGVAGYLAGFLWAVRPLAQVARAKAPAAYATWSVMAAVIWLFGSLPGLVVVLVGSPTWLQASDWLGLLVMPLAAGFAAQILLGAMSFLVPLVLGGGPTILRGTQARMDSGNALRATVVNAGLVICLLPVPAKVRALV